VPARYACLPAVVPPKHSYNLHLRTDQRTALWRYVWKCQRATLMFPEVTLLVSIACVLHCNTKLCLLARIVVLIDPAAAADNAAFVRVIN